MQGGTTCLQGETGKVQEVDDCGVGVTVVVHGVMIVVQGEAISVQRVTVTEQRVMIAE